MKNKDGKSVKVIYNAQADKFEYIEVPQPDETFIDLTKYFKLMFSKSAHDCYVIFAIPRRFKRSNETWNEWLDLISLSIKLVLMGYFILFKPNKFR